MGVKTHIEAHGLVQTLGVDYDERVLPSIIQARVDVHAGMQPNFMHLHFPTIFCAFRLTGDIEERSCTVQCKPAADDARDCQQGHPADPDGACALL